MAPDVNMPPSEGFKKNQLISALPATQWSHWRKQLEIVQMPLAHVLYEPGVAMKHIYFPLTAIVSLLYVMHDGASAEIAVVGNEGLVGVAIFMGGTSTTSRAVVQSAA